MDSTINHAVEGGGGRQSGWLSHCVSSVSGCHNWRPWFEWNRPSNLNWFDGWKLPVSIRRFITALESIGRMNRRPFTVSLQRSSQTNEPMIVILLIELMPIIFLSRFSLPCVLSAFLFASHRLAQVSRWLSKMWSFESCRQVPVQRITKYPLLLGRLLRATAPQDVETREALREAQAKVESYLTAINAVITPWIIFFFFYQSARLIRRGGRHRPPLSATGSMALMTLINQPLNES